MARLSETAHVTVKGSRVTAQSPLEDQVQAVYQAAHRYALANRFTTHVHQGPHGPRKGLAGPMVMKRLIGQLIDFPSTNDFNTAYGLISKVLKKTDGAVCIKHPKPGAPGPQIPEWFIADTMPENIVVVALYVQRQSAGQTPPSSFDEEAYLTKREKYRVTADEAGETHEPAPVTVRKTDGRSTNGENLDKTREQIKEDHRILVNRVMDEIQTTPIPLTADEIHHIINRDPEFDYHVSTYRSILNDLVNEGKVSRRKESLPERTTRGGGSPPKGGAKYLYWIGLGPVPGRTALPAGITPAKSARAWMAELNAQLQGDRDAVLGYLGATPKDQRSRGIIQRALGISAERLNVALDTLVRDGLIYTRQWKYYLSDTGPGVALAAPVQEETAPTPTNEPQTMLPATTPEDIVQLTPTAVPDPDSLQLVLDLAAKLGVTLPTGPDPETEVLRSEYRALNETIEERDATIERLRGQVAALRAAIASFE